MPSKKFRNNNLFPSFSFSIKGMNSGSCFFPALVSYVIYFQASPLSHFNSV